MGLNRQVCTLVLFAVASNAALAGDIYICKNASGSKTYQNTPCATAAATLKHGTFDPALEQQLAAPVNQGQQVAVQQRRVSSGEAGMQAVSYGGAQPSQQDSTAAYQCTAGRRTWVQRSPCPTTYGVGTSEHIEGFTAGGTHVSGTAFGTQQAPVQQNSLNQQTLCDQVNSGAKMGRGLSDTEQSYERNKIRHEQCGG